MGETIYRWGSKGKTYSKSMRQLSTSSNNNYNNTNVKVNNNNENHNDDNTTTTTLLLLLPLLLLLLLLLIIIIIYSNNNDNTGIQQRHIYKEALHSMFFRSNFLEKSSTNLSSMWHHVKGYKEDMKG